MNAIGNATADVAYPNWRITRRSLGIGGYFNEVPRALPVGLHWRTLKSDGEINPKYPGGIEDQKTRLESEGHKVIQKRKKYVVEDYEKHLIQG